MTTLPTLTICILTFKRPYYAVPTIYGLRERLRYAGPRRFVVIDGGSPQEDLDLYAHALGKEEKLLAKCSNIAAGHNRAAAIGGDVWLAVLDDYELRTPIDLTPDVEMLLANPSVGAVRLAALAYWSFGLAGTRISTEMVYRKPYHWHALDKARSTSPHVHCMAANLYHRRFWDAYGDIPVVASDMPGDCEERAGALFFNRKQGPTIAWPMRFGEGESEPFRHIGYLRSDDYAAKGARWGAIDVLDDPHKGNVAATL